MALKGKHGAMLAGRYRLLEQLGEGGMGSVWKAEHLVLHSHVAIKIVDPDVARLEFNLARFLREAKTLASLRSPNVVQVLDFGSDAETPYLVMELLEGQTLGSRLTKKGRLSLAETSHILRDVCNAMSLVHEQGLIHRDLKPDNIFLCEVGEQRITKIVDFGIAKSMRPDLVASMKTRTGHMLGTPSYMSPEQCRGLKDIDHRADLWALGVIAYECLVGKVPFEGAVLGDLLLRICMDPLPIPSRQVHGGLPDAFDAWFARAVARDREVRFQSALELATTLAELTPATGHAGGALASDVREPGARSAPLWSAPQHQVPQRSAPQHQVSLWSAPQHQVPQGSAPRHSSPQHSAPLWSASMLAPVPQANPRHTPNTETNTTVGLGSMAAFTGGRRVQVLVLGAVALASALGLWALGTKRDEAGTSVGVQSLRPPYEAIPKVIRKSVPSGRRWQPTALPADRASQVSAAGARPEVPAAPAAPAPSAPTAPVQAETIAPAHEALQGTAPGAFPSAPSQPSTSGATPNAASPGFTENRGHAGSPAPSSGASQQAAPGAFTNVAPGDATPADPAGEAGAPPRALRGTAAPAAPDPTESGSEIRTDR